uniref:Knr4/Smi1-like domain-containing protein n=1 Tax=Panagrolaimus davidi TaxID=227884 RepID=A0A914QWU4_9BILA
MVNISDYIEKFKTLPPFTNTDEEEDIEASVLETFENLKIIHDPYFCCQTLFNEGGYEWDRMLYICDDEIPLIAFCSADSQGNMYFVDCYGNLFDNELKLVQSFNHKKYYKYYNDKKIFNLTPFASDDEYLECLIENFDILSNEAAYSCFVKETEDKLDIANPEDEIFEFRRPSDDTLEKACDKLSTLSTTPFEYNPNAYKFWAEIYFRQITSYSNQLQSHTFKSQNIFACFSQFFTGTNDSCFLIQHILNTAFRKDLNASSAMSSSEIDELFSSNTVTDQYLEFIANVLSCRIGVYKNEFLMKYGNWETQNNVDVLTLVLSFENGFYSVVLDL